MRARVAGLAAALIVLPLAVGALRPTRVAAAVTSGQVRGIVPVHGSSGVKAATTTEGNMTNHGGPVEATSASYAIFWQVPGSTAFTSGYEKAITNYLTDVGGTSFYDIMSQYPGAGNEALSNSSTFVAASSYTGAAASGATGASASHALTDADIQSAVSAAMSANSWTADSFSSPGKVFFVFLPESTWLQAGGQESFTSFCAYHNDFQPASGQEIVYAAMPYVDSPEAGGGCQSSTGPYPNATLDPSGDADNEIATTSHEQFESITDPESDAASNPTGWFFKTAGGGEIGDMCEFDDEELDSGSFGQPEAPASGTSSILHGDSYLLESKWSNTDATSAGKTPAGACDLWYPESQLAVTSTATSVAAGVPVTVTVRAADKAGATVTSYAGTVHATSPTDPGATLPADTAFTRGDNGQVSLSVTFDTGGIQTVTFTDTATPGVTGTLTFSSGSTGGGGTGGGGGGAGGGGGGGGGAAPTTTTSTTSTTVPPVSSFDRLAGADRIGTAIAVSQRAFGADQASAVVLSRSDAFADALAGTPLAAAKKGPLLLTPPGAALDPGVDAEIQRVLPAGSTVYILGGTAAVSPDVDSTLDASYRVVRLSGADRYATAVAVATTGLGSPSTALVATGIDFPDALAAGAAAAKLQGVVLLTDGASLPASTASYLSSATTVYALGGPAAAADPAATPLVGSDRFATAVLAAQTFFPDPPAVGVADGLAFPDALAGGAFTGVLGGPLLLVTPGSLPGSVASYLSAVRGSLTSAFVFGGTAAVGDTVVGALDAALTG